MKEFRNKYLRCKPKVIPDQGKPWDKYVKSEQASLSISINANKHKDGGAYFLTINV
jgi:hypothetical protein